ncbi:unnamed protein product [Brassica oleracea var. botrytis]
MLAFCASYIRLGLHRCLPSLQNSIHRIHVYDSFSLKHYPSHTVATFIKSPLRAEPLLPLLSPRR